MIVAVQKGMDHMSSKLRDMGFEVVSYGDYQYPVDAIVYSGSSIGLDNINSANIALDSSPHGSRGVLMVNASGKSASEVAGILNRRTYTPLF